MPDPTTDPQLDEFLEIRKPGAHLDEGVVQDDFVLMLGVDLTNYPKFARVDDDTTYAKAELDIRDQLDVDSGAELPDYAGTYRADLRFTDFSREALASRFLPWSEAYLLSVRRRVGSRGRPALRRRDDGRDRVDRVERPGPPRARADDGRVPARRARRTTTRTSRSRRRIGRTPGSSTPACSLPAATPSSTKEQLVTWLLGSHEYLLQCIEAWATQITVRYGLDEMFDIQWTLWGDDGPARGEEAEGASTSASPATPSPTG